MTTTLEHIDALRDVFSDLTQDCALLDLAPITVRVSKMAGGDFDAWVQFAGTDTHSVDALADTWGFGSEEAAPGRNYSRRGRVDLNDRAVEVVIFTGCPADYAPHAVQA